MTGKVCIVFTRNWIDGEGKGHGFRFTSVSAFDEFAAARVADLNSHKVASKSHWEFASVPAELIMGLVK